MDLTVCEVLRFSWKWEKAINEMLRVLKKGRC